MIKSRLTFANVISLLALFVALGGVGYAAGVLPRNSVGTAQLKKNAVTSAKVKNHSITGADIKVSSLPTVPSATSAGHAADADSAATARSAASATRATSAAHATSADSAITAAAATHADSAADAAALGGRAAAAYQRTCPAGEVIDSVGGAGAPGCLRVADLAFAGGSSPPSLAGATKLLLAELPVHLAGEATILATATPGAETKNQCAPAFSCTVHYGLYLDGEPMDSGGDQSRSAAAGSYTAEFTAIQGMSAGVAAGDHLLDVYLLNAGAGGLITPAPASGISAIVLSE